MSERWIYLDKMKSIFLNIRFFQAIGLLILIFILGYSLPILYFLAQILFLLFLVLLLFDIYLLFNGENQITGQRIVADRLSNGDQNKITLHLKNNYPFKSKCNIIDEIPFQFQRRDIHWETTISAQNEQLFQYELRPTKRGYYDFGVINVFAHSPIGLIRKRFKIGKPKTIPVYPSYLQMKKYEFYAFASRYNSYGQKRVKRLGHSTQFELIKEYVSGDDPRTINWKATSRTHKLMVNQYQDEKARPIYCIIDKGRMMKMPFEGMTLLDYSINASLVLANIAIQSDDKAGILTFSKKMSAFIKADKRNAQMQIILENLFGQRTKYLDSNFELLYAFVSQKITQRSLLLLFTNFESYSGFERRLPFFQAMSKKHLLVVIFFKNTELHEMVSQNPTELREVYHQTYGEQILFEKQLIINKLKSLGILTIYTEPNHLTVNTINKYLEVKSRGIL